MHEIESFSVRRIEDLVASTLMASGRALTPAASGAALSSSSTNMTEGQAVQGGWGVPTGLRFQPVAIEATGRDPLKSKLAGDCYTTHDGCGVTTRACSGVLVCGASGGAAVVIAPIFAIAPFLRELPRMASDPLLIAGMLYVCLCTPPLTVCCAQTRGFELAFLAALTWSGPPQSW